MKLYYDIINIKITNFIKKPVIEDDRRFNFNVLLTSLMLPA